MNQSLLAKGCERLTIKYFRFLTRQRLIKRHSQTASQGVTPRLPVIDELTSTYRF
jgi:hypothetical protein